MVEEGLCLGLGGDEGGEGARAGVADYLGDGDVEGGGDAQAGVKSGLAFPTKKATEEPTIYTRSSG